MREVHSVHEMRLPGKALNFSAWGAYGPEQHKLLNESCEEVREGQMPMFTYMLLHSDAKLSRTDAQVICALAQIAHGR